MESSCTLRIKSFLFELSLRHSYQVSLNKVRTLPKLSTSKRNVNSPYFQFLNKVPLHAIMADSLKWSLDNIEYKSV